MDREQILRLYDQCYVEKYEEKFIKSTLAVSDSAFELDLLRRFLQPGVTWLDVACGTGYFLKHFPTTERARLDLSPAMLEQARRANPGVTFVERDFCIPCPEWNDRWDLVSCMWYAYGLVESMNDVLVLIRNLAAWTRSDGRCFVPLANPSLIAGTKLPYEVAGPWQGRVLITAIAWSYVEDDGRKVHAHQLAPAVPFLIEEFSRYFQDIEVIEYPPAAPGWESRSALVASRKR